jgi:folate-dependent phosphoribosylglycinamide formyltransferase PurN
MRVVTLTCEGLSQSHLEWRLAQACDLVGRVKLVGERPGRWRRLRSLWTRHRDPRRAFAHLEARRSVRVAEEANQGLVDALFREAGEDPTLPPGIPCLAVRDVNDPSCLDLVRDLRPDVVVVNGTNLLRGPWFETSLQPPLGILNIHTGLSPYSRGGNCNLYMILHRQPQLVGVTVHHIDAGIDSGDIVYSDRPAFSAADSFESLDAKSFRLGEDLLIVALEQVEAGRASRTPQWKTGRLFLQRTGYSYQPHHRLLANRLLREEGLLEQYLLHRDRFDEAVRWFPPAPGCAGAGWRHPLV